MNNLVIIANTRYGNDEVSNRRASLAIKSLQVSQKAGVEVLLYDWGSSNKDFLDAARNHQNVTFNSSQYINYSEQIIESLTSVYRQYSGTNTNFLRMELEKFGLLSDENIKKIKGIFDTADSGLEMIGLGCTDRGNMPDFQKISEEKVAKNIKDSLAKVGADLSDYDLEGETVGSLLGPIGLTISGIHNLLLDDRDSIVGNTLFFRRKARLVLESSPENKKVIFQELPFSYDKEREMIPENIDTKILLEAFGFPYNKVGLEDFCKMFLNCDQEIMNSPKILDFQKKYPNNLALKRLKQYYEIGCVVCEDINNYAD